MIYAVLLFTGAVVVVIYFRLFERVPNPETTYGVVMSYDEEDKEIKLIGSLARLSLYGQAHTAVVVYSDEFDISDPAKGLFRKIGKEYYTANGADLRGFYTVRTARQSWYKTGKRIKVRYNKQNPRQSSVQKEPFLYISVIVILMLSAFCLYRADL